MRITTANVRGLGHVVCQGGGQRADRGLREMLKKVDPDICLLTETKLLDETARPEEYRNLRQWWGQHLDHKNIFIDCVEQGVKRRGVAILIKAGLIFKVNGVRKSGRGRHIMVNITLNAHTYIIVCFYGYDRSTDSISHQTLENMHEDLKEFVAQHPGEIIIGGDFNFIMTPEDATSQVHQKPNTKRLMLQIMEEFNLEDGWLHIQGENPDEDGHTYFNSRGKTSRLDRIYAQERSMHLPHIQVHERLPDISDHRMLTLDLRPLKQSKPLPKHPDYLLHSPKYREQLCNTIREFIIQHSYRAETYCDTPADGETERLMREIANEGEFNCRTVTVDETCLLKKRFFDASSEVKRSKINNLFKEIYDEPSDPSPSQLQDMMDQLVDSLDLNSGEGARPDHEKEKPSSILDTLLQKILDFSFKFRKIHKDLNPAEMIKLKQKQIDKLKKDGHNTDDNIELATLEEHVRMETQKLNISRQKISTVRANLNEDKPTRQYLGRGKNNAVKTRITRIKTNDAELKGEEAERHMENLFKKLLGQKSQINESATVEDFLGDAKDCVPKLSEELCEDLDRDISIEELDDVVRKAHSGSSPGMTGVSYQLIKEIWPLIRRLFLLVARELMGTTTDEPAEQLPDRWLKRRIILLQKPHKPPENDGSYRPISLLEICYKLLAGVIASRLKRATQHLIGPSQKGYMAGRCAMDVTRAVQDTRDIALRKRWPLAIIGLDFSKAFDTVSHDGLVKILRFYNFPPRLLQRIQLLLHGAEITLDINGSRKSPFKLRDGTGQGDPISSYLFNLVAEIFINAIIHSPDSELFHIGVEKALPEAYADDIHIFAKGDSPDAIRNIIDKAERFQELTGLALSKPKTEYLSIGASHESLLAAMRHNLKIVDSIKFVGAHVTAQPGKEENILNYKNAFEAIERVERMWSWRRPTPLGATLIARTLMTSTMTHLLMNFSLEKEQIKKYDQITRHFIWENTRPQVQLKRMIQPLERGGMNLTSIDDFTTSLRTRWYRILSRKAAGEPITENWIHALQLWLDEIGDFKVKDIPKMGYKALRKLGQILRRNGCDFWGENFIRYAPVVMTSELKTDNLTALPIFGGIIMDKAPVRNSKLLCLFNDNGVTDYIFRRHKTVGDLFQSHGAGRIDTSLPLQAENVYPTNDFGVSGLCTKVRKAFTRMQELVWQTILSLPISGRCGIKDVFQFPFKISAHHLVAKCLAQPKGSSFVYKDIIRAKAIQGEVTVPPSYHTAQRDQNHNMSEQDWTLAIRRLHKTHGNSRAKWLSMQAFLRTLWTPLKLYNSTGTLDDALCPGCEDHWPTNTAHLLYECGGLATNVWNFIRDILSSTLNRDYKLNRNNILYYQHITSYTEVALITAAKYAIVRVARTVRPPIHPKVAMTFLNTEINGVANTNIHALRDTATWAEIQRAANWKMNHMRQVKSYVCTGV